MVAFTPGQAAHHTTAPTGCCLLPAAAAVQGFPRSDIDITAVRTDRNRVVCLSNDHKALSNRIHVMLAQLHELQR